MTLTASQQDAQRGAVNRVARLSTTQMVNALWRLTYQQPGLVLALLDSFEDPSKPEDGWIR